MLLALVIVVCVVLLVLGFILPRLSSYPQRGVDKTLSRGERGASHAPGRLGRWLRKPFSSSRRAADKSAGLGRRARRRAPF